MISAPTNKSRIARLFCWASEFGNSIKVNNATWLKFCALSGASAVMLGAFAAHGMAGKLTAHSMQTLHTAVLYQFIHTLAIVGVLGLETKGRFKCWTLRLFAFGILVFSGSLYLLVFTGQRWLGAITPFGGTAFILGWLSLLLATRQPSK